MVKLKKYINKENEVQFYYVYIYIGFLLAVLSGSLVVRGVLEGKGIGYLCLWTAGIAISVLMATSLRKNMKRRPLRKIRIYNEKQNNVPKKHWFRNILEGDNKGFIEY